MNPIPRLLLGTITYYDMFGDEVGMAFYNGYIQVECEIGPSLYICTLDRVHLIDPTGETVWSATCKDRVTLRLDINENTTFGEYKCQYKNESSFEVLPYEYRFCAPEASEAELEACKDWSFSNLHGHCVVTANGIDPYDTIEKSWCLPSNDTGGVTYCKEQTFMGQESSLCKSLVDDFATIKIRSLVSGDKFCFQDLHNGVEAQVHGGLLKDTHAYGARISVITKVQPPDKHADATKTDAKNIYVYSAVWIQCPGCYIKGSCGEENISYTATCGISKRNGEPIENRTFHNCGGYYDISYVFNHSVFIDDQFDLYKFKCVFDNGTAVVARTQHYLVDFGTGITASVHKTKKVSGNSKDTETKFECRLNIYPSFPWQVEWKWYDDSPYLSSKGEMRQISWANESTLSMTVSEPTKYWCAAAITYYSCSRDLTHKKFEMIIQRDSITAGGAPFQSLRFGELLIVHAITTVWYMAISCLHT